MVAKIQIDDIDLSRYECIKDKYNRVVDGISHGRAIYYDSKNSRYIKIFHPDYCRLENFRKAINVNFFEGLAHALSHLIYDGESIIGYITDEGPVLSENEFDSHLIPRDFFRILKNRIKESGIFFYDLVPHNIILKDGIPSLIDLESVYDISEYGKLSLHNAKVKPAELDEYIISLIDSEVDMTGLQEIDLDKVYFRLFDDQGNIHPVKIENSPVYKVLQGDTKPYDEYYKRMHKLGRAKETYMSTDEFLKFAKSFNYLEHPYEDDYIRVKKTGHLYAGWDGAHRLSCLKHQGKRVVKVNVMGGEFKHKGYSNLVNVAKIFNNIDYSDYVIIKDDGMFPNYIDYDDLDILCKDRSELRNQVSKQIDEYSTLGFNIVEKEKGVRNHIDLIPPGFDKLNFRIDLLDQLPYMKQFHHHTNQIEVDSKFYDTVLSRKVTKEFNYPLMYDSSNKFKANFPCAVDDLVLRFMEWVWQPHKTRHIKYVINNLKSEHEAEFIKTVNTFTNIEVDSNYVKEIMEQQYE